MDRETRVQGPGSRVQGLDLTKEELAVYAPPQPSDDMVDRIMAHIDADTAVAEIEPSSSRPPRRWGYALAAIGAIAAAIIIAFWPFSRTVIEEEVVATAPRHVALGDRADALLEAGATLAYTVEPDGQCHVVQSHGEVLYQVTSGGDFVVETPAGRVSVLGTRFRVEVDEMGTSLVKKASYGAAATLLVTVALYEGMLLFENDQGQVALAEGDVATAREGEAPLMSEPGSAVPTTDAGTPSSRVRRFKSPEAREELRRAIEDRREARLHEGRSTSSTTTPPPDEERPQGYHSREYIRETVGEIIPLIQECYETNLEQAPQASGRVAVHFNIVGEEDVGGLVETAEIVELDEGLGNLPDFEECLVQTILSIEVDPPEGGGEVNVTYPFVFRSAEEGAGERDQEPQEVQ